MFLILFLLFIIAICLGIIIFILVRKFPLVASIDVEKIRREQQAKVKRELLESRLGRKLAQSRAKMGLFFGPLARFLGEKIMVSWQRLMRRILKYIERVVKLEPKNPRLLDLLFRVSIIVKDKDLALKTLERLKKVSPEHKRIEEFEKKIEQMPR